MERLKIDAILDAERKTPVVAQLVGMPLLDAIAATGVDVDVDSKSLVVLNHGIEIKRELWAGYNLQADDRILVGVLPQGNKKGGLIQILLGVVLIAAAYFIPLLAPYAVNLYFAGAGFILTGIASFLIKPPSLGTNASSTREDRDSSYYGLTGQGNSSRPYGVVPKLYGKYKMFPNIAATPMVVNTRSNSTIAAIYDFGLGWVDIADVRIGDTPAYNFSPRLAYHVNTKTITPQYQIGKVSYQQFSFTLQDGIPFTFRSAKKATRVAIDLAFPQGLYSTDSQGHPGLAEVRFRLSVRNVTTNGPVLEMNAAVVRGMNAKNVAVIVGYQQATQEVNGFVNTVNVGANEFWERYTINGTELAFIPYVAGQTYTLPAAIAGLKAGDVLSRGRATNTPGQNRLNVTGSFPIWSNEPGFLISDVSTRPAVARLDLPMVDEGEYEVVLTRLTPVSQIQTLVDNSVVTLVASGFAGTLFRLTAPHTMLEMEVDGSEKLSGTVQNLSALCGAVIPHYDAVGTLYGHAISSNPARIALDVLLNEWSDIPVTPAQVDFASFDALAQYCDEPRTWTIDGVVKTDVRHKVDVVIDYKATIKEILESVLSTCRAMLVVTQTGKYGVAIDRLRTVPRQLITPENSWGFTGERVFTAPVHALRVGFIDAEREYQRQEITVYADGYSEANAINIEPLSTFGITDYWHAWAYGRYMLAQAVFRNEVFSVKMDIENLVVQRGDLVYVQHDVPKVGGLATRIVEVVGNIVQLSQSLSTTVFAYTARKEDGTVVQGNVVRVVSADMVELDTAAGLLPGDLIVVGLVTRTTQPYLVSAITPEQDLAATLTLIKYVPEIYDADTGPMPPWDPGFGDDLINALDMKVVNLQVQRELTYPQRIPTQHNILTYEVTSPFFSYAEVYWLPNGQRPVLIGSYTSKSADDLFSLIASVKKSQGEVTYRVTPFTSTGLQGVSAEITVPVMANDKPNPPQDFDLDLRRDVITLSWNNTNDLDISHYEIRYSPNLVDATYDESTVVAPSVPWPATTFDVQARIGTYYAKAVDTAGQRSEFYSVAYTPAEDLFFLNVVGELDDGPTGWKGGMSGFRLNDAGDGICTVESSPGVFVRRSEYYYAETFDNGRIFQTRLESNIAAHSYSTRDMMDTWVPLEIAVPIAGSDLGVGGLGSSMSEEIRVWHEVRWFDKSALAMKDWTPLATAAPLGFSSSDFGQWRAFFAGDYTGKTFQFRLVAEYIGTNPNPNAGVNIKTAKIKIDMHDRTEGAYNIDCPTAGIYITYTPSFKVRPTLMITPDILVTGEQYAITQQTERGFHIAFTDSTGAAIQRKFDWLAKGYGYEGTREVPGRNYSPPAHARAVLAEVL
jgi:hypothetical protein